MALGHLGRYRFSRACDRLRHVHGYTAGNRVQDGIRLETAEANKLAAEASERAAEAIERANTLQIELLKQQQRTAQAEKELFILRQALNRTVASAAPRRLSEAQKTALVGRLRPLLPFKVKFMNPSSNSTKEVFDFAADMADVFVRLGVLPPGNTVELGPLI